MAIEPQTSSFGFSAQPAYAVHIRLTPELKAAIVQAQQAGHAVSLRFKQDGPFNQQAILTIGGQEFFFSSASENNCDVIQLPDSSDPQPECTAVGCIKQKLNMQRTLDDGLKSRVRASGMEAQMKARQRQAVLVDQQAVHGGKKVTKTKTITRAATPPAAAPAAPTAAPQAAPAARPPPPAPAARPPVPPASRPPARQELKKSLEPPKPNSMKPAGAQRRPAAPPGAAGAAAAAPTPPAATPPLGTPHSTPPHAGPAADVPAAAAAQLQQQAVAPSAAPAAASQQAPLEVPRSAVLAAARGDAQLCVVAIIWAQPTQSLSTPGLTRAIDQAYRQARQKPEAKEYLKRVIQAACDLVPPNRQRLKPEVLERELPKLEALTLGGAGPSGAGAGAAAAQQQQQQQQAGAKASHSPGASPTAGASVGAGAAAAGAGGPGPGSAAGDGAVPPPKKKKRIDVGSGSAAHKSHGGAGGHVPNRSVSMYIEGGVSVPRKKTKTTSLNAQTAGGSAPDAAAAAAGVATAAAAAGQKRKRDAAEAGAAGAGAGAAGAAGLGQAPAAAPGPARPPVPVRPKSPEDWDADLDYEPMVINRHAKASKADKEKKKGPAQQQQQQQGAAPKPPAAPKPRPAAVPAAKAAPAAAAAHTSPPTQAAGDMATQAEAPRPGRGFGSYYAMGAHPDVSEGRGGYDEEADGGEEQADADPQGAAGSRDVCSEPEPGSGSGSVRAGRAAAQAARRPSPASVGPSPGSSAGAGGPAAAAAAAVGLDPEDSAYAEVGSDEEDPDAQLYAPYLDLEPGSSGRLVLSPEEHEAAHREYNLKYEVYFKVHQKYNEVVRRAEGWRSAIDKAESEEQKAAWRVELWRYGARNHVRMKRWRRVLANLHTELQSIRDGVTRFLQDLQQRAAAQ